MGCDAYADEKGEFEMKIYGYDTQKTLCMVQITGLEPKERISFDLFKGDYR